MEIQWKSNDSSPGSPGNEALRESPEEDWIRPLDVLLGRPLDRIQYLVDREFISVNRSNWPKYYGQYIFPGSVR